MDREKYSYRIRKGYKRRRRPGPPGPAIPGAEPPGPPGQQLNIYVSICCNRGGYVRECTGAGWKMDFPN